MDTLASAATTEMVRIFVGIIVLSGDIKRDSRDDTINPLKTKRRPLYLKTQFVPRCCAMY